MSEQVEKNTENTEKQVDVRAKLLEFQGVLNEGAGVLELKTPIKAGGVDLETLEYDFKSITGMEYVDAMTAAADHAQQGGLTDKQALYLFAQAASKTTKGKADRRDIVDRIGIEDTIQAVDLARAFFRGSSLAGRLRISKR